MVNSFSRPQRAGRHAILTVSDANDAVPDEPVCCDDRTHEQEAVILFAATCLQMAIDFSRSLHRRHPCRAGSRRCSGLLTLRLGPTQPGSTTTEDSVRTATPLLLPALACVRHWKKVTVPAGTARARTAFVAVSSRSPGAPDRRFPRCEQIAWRSISLPGAARRLAPVR